MRKPHLPTRATAVIAAVLLALAGCGDAGGDGNGDESGTTQEQTSEGWQELDPCGLLDDGDVAALIGPGAIPEDTTDLDRPSCTWTVEGSNESLDLRLWQPPIPEVLTDAERELAVGDHTGYVESEGKGYCNLHVEAEPAWLSLRVNVPFEKFQPGFCDTAAGTAEQVLSGVE